MAKAWSRWIDPNGVICDNKMKALFYKAVRHPTLLYRCETLSMWARDEKRMSTTGVKLM